MRNPIEALVSLKRRYNIPQTEIAEGGIPNIRYDEDVRAIEDALLVYAEDERILHQVRRRLKKTKNIDGETLITMRGVLKTDEEYECFEDLLERSEK